MLNRYEKEKSELSGMSTTELEAYGRICKMSKGMISTGVEKFTRHGLIVGELLAERK